MSAKHSLHRMKSIVSAILLAAFLTGSLTIPAIAAPFPEDQCSATHTVQVSDTLVKIIQRYRVNWKDLVRLNNLASPSYTIYVGQRLCIPKVKKEYTVPKGSAFKSVPANFAVIRKNNNLVIYTTNFPKNNVFAVKVDDTKAEGLNWYKIGTIRTGGKRSSSYTYKLPTQLVKSSFFTICVKNMTTDAAACRNIVAGP